MNSTTSLIIFFSCFLTISALALLPIWRGADRFSKQILVAALGFSLILSAYLYSRLGAHADLSIRDQYQHLAERGAAGEGVAESEWLELLGKIRLRAEQTDGAEYWYLLGGAYEQFGRYEEAAESYEQAARFYADDPLVLARWAETEFIRQGYNLTPKVEEVARRVVAIDPSNATVLGLLGIAAFQSGEPEAAIQLWTRGLENLPPNSENAQIFRTSIARAQQLIATTNAGQSGSPSEASPAAVVGIPIQVALASNVDVPPSTVLFVFARSPGSPMPLAVSRMTAADLPARVILDDSMAMIPGTKLMDLPAVDIVARLSFSGQPTAQPGDYEVIKSGIVPANIEGSVVLELADRIQ